MYRLTVYIPEDHCEKVKEALFEAGAGRYEGYSHCAWQTLGEGQFKPLQNSSPFIGKTNHIEHVAEYKVEMIVEHAKLGAVVEALKSSHPYEEPAYQIIQCVDPDTL